MTNREFAELKERLQKASPRELRQLFIMLKEKDDTLKGSDPFSDPKNRLLLPSEIKKIAIDTLEKMFRAGMVTAKKDS